MKEFQEEIDRLNREISDLQMRNKWLKTGCDNLKELLRECLILFDSCLLAINNLGTEEQQLINSMLAGKVRIKMRTILLMVIDFF